MKILHVIPKQKMGGVETAVFSAYENINRVHCDFNIVIIEKMQVLWLMQMILLRLNASLINPMVLSNLYESFIEKSLIL